MAELKSKAELLELAEGQMEAVRTSYWDTQPVEVALHIGAAIAYALMAQASG